MICQPHLATYTQENNFIHATFRPVYELHKLRIQRKKLAHICQQSRSDNVELYQCKCADFNFTPRTPRCRVPIWRCLPLLAFNSDPVIQELQAPEQGLGQQGLVGQQSCGQLHILHIEDSWFRASEVGTARLCSS